MNASPEQNKDPEVNQSVGSMKTLTGIVYLLQLLGVPTGGITGIIGVIINYVKRGSVEGTWLASHFTWQIKTFWFVFILELAGIATLALGVGHFILIGAAVFLIFRIIRGWTRLNMDRPIEDTEL